MDRLYRMILVDDEDEVRGRISSKISEESGFQVVGTAGNGYDALELIESLDPDVVLTDIKMPYIDGIELASIIRREYPTVRVGFITGYNEFDYARQAIQLQVRSYLTKPLTEQDILSFLTSLRHELDQEYQQKYNRETLLKQYQDSIPLLIENSLSALMVVPSTEVRPLAEQLRGYQVELDDQPFILALVRVERNSRHWDVIEFEKLKLSVRNTIEKGLEKSNIDFYSFMFQENIVLLLKERGALFYKEVDAVLYQIIRNIEHFLSVRVSIGVSEAMQGFPSLRSAYDQAAKAHEAGRVQNLGQLIYASQLPRLSSTPVTVSESEAVALKSTLRYGSLEEVKEALIGLKSTASRRADASALKEQNPGGGSSYRLFMLTITDSLIQYAGLLDLDIRQVLGVDIFETLYRMASLDEFIGWILHAVEQIRLEGQRSKWDNGEQLLGEVLDYLEQHFANRNLTMQMVCDAQGLSISYLSQLFKKYRKTTFVTYLTALRMEHAKDRLRMSGNRIVEVAEACGYRDVYYFSHCFKKYSGVSPKKFRENAHAL